MAEELVGRRFGNYVVEKLLGAGGMGAVYMAVQPDIGKRVAIKFLAEHLTQNASLVQRFFAEGRAVNLIQHENIVDIFDFGYSEDGQVYCVMEMLSGVSLEDELRAHGCLPVERTLKIVAQLADALSAAHQRNILHRDVKPDNVYLVKKKGNPDFVKVLDFGIAKLGDLGDGSTLRTASGTIMGTPGYMSPEQGTAGDVDARTDIYATGALLYRCLGGQLPFLGRSFGEILQRQLTELPASLRSLNADVPERIEALVHAMLALDPTHRPSTMAEVCRFLSDDSVEAPALPTSPTLASRTPVLMAAVTPSTTLSGAAAEKTQRDPSTEVQRGRGSRSAILALAAGVVAIGAVGLVALRTRAPVTPPPVAAVPAPAPALPPVAAPAAPGKFDVTITSAPPGATVLDGAVVLGVTPVTLSFDREQAVRLQLAGFRDETVEIRRDRPQLTARLVAAPAAATHKRPVTSHATGTTEKSAAPVEPKATEPAPPEKKRGDVVKEVPF